MGKLYDSMIENGVNKGNLMQGSSMCIMGHLAHVFLPQGLWVIEQEDYEEVYDKETHQYVERYFTRMVEVDFRTFINEGSVGEQDLYDKVDSRIMQVVQDVISEEFPATEEGDDEGSWIKWDFNTPWAFNDDENITEDDILRVGKLVDERLNELGLEGGE